jgi:hypothetical protein
MIFLNHSMSTELDENRYESLLIPPNVTLSYLDFSNWYYEDIQPEEGCVGEIHLKNKASGFEDIGYQFKAAQVDLDLMCEGSLDKWKEQKMSDFQESLQYKRKQFLDKIKNSLKIAIGN